MKITNAFLVCRGKGLLKHFNTLSTFDRNGTR
jgi:hypothetical protein